MKGSLRVIAVVPARGGYDEVPYLNIKKLGPLPLVAHTLQQAAESRYIDRTIVSTDDDQVAEVAREHGAEVPFRRPPELSGKIPLLKPVIAHGVTFLEAEEGEKIDIVVVLQATSPFRTAEQIDDAIDKLVEEGFDSVISLSEEKTMAWRVVEKKLTPLFVKPGRREEMDPIYRETGAVWALTREALDMPERLGRNIGYIVTDKGSSITVHDIYDFWLAEKLVRLPRILFRVDGGVRIGMGHVYRSLAIAEEIRSISPAADIQFLMKAEHAEGVQRVSSEGYPVRILSDESPGAVMLEIQEYSPNIIVNDIPAPMRTDYLEALAKLGASTVNLVDSIDDIEKPAELASVIIAVMHDDQVELEDFYGGPAFTILRESFAGKPRVVREKARQVVASFGGSDPQGLTLRVLRAMNGLAGELGGLEVSAVLGPAFSYKKELEGLLPKLSYQPRVLESVEHMADVLSEADVVFCSGGMTVFEIAALGTPGVVLCQNAREQRRMEAFANEGSVLYLGLGTEVGEAVIRSTARDLLCDIAQRRTMSEAGRKLVDARGTQRAAKVVISTPRGPAMGGSQT
jgi:spore coat polysaccharide biosynthesis predicted glycosyltransferase SpsG/spore coat polysaccharide biosynthesis protein SpsF (cytidylyltransferase family)